MSILQANPLLRHWADPGLRLSGGFGLVYLLRDDFITADPAPVASPRTAEPGPGTLTITDTNSKLSIVDGKLSFATGGAAAGNPGIWGTEFARVVGRALIASSNKSAGGLEVGWDTNQAGATVDSFRNSAGSPSLILANSVAIAGETPANSTDYMVAIVMRTSGNFYFIKGGVFTNWTMVWVGTGSVGTRYPAAVVNGTTTVGIVDFLRVLDLVAPFNDDYGLATQRLAGNVVAGTGFVHEANCVIEWIQTAIPTAGFTRFSFRSQDASNHWHVRIDSAGAIGLWEQVATVFTIRGSHAGPVLAGQRIMVIADGTTIRVYVNNVLLITYASAAAFATETDGSPYILGTGGAISDIVTWPRVPSAAALSILDSAVA